MPIWWCSWGLTYAEQKPTFFFSFLCELPVIHSWYYTWGLTYAEQLWIFFFRFLRKYLYSHSCYHTWGCTYFGFSRFLDLKKNIFGKMQSGAEKVSTLMRRNMYVWCCSWEGYACWGFWIFKKIFSENAEQMEWRLN